MKKKVFVLGAGSSMPYGYPSGAELLNKLKRTRQEEFDVYRSKFGHKPREVHGELLTKIASPSVYSIDRFLTNHIHNTDLTDYAKYLVRNVIKRHEGTNEVHFHSSGKTNFDFPHPFDRKYNRQDWIEYLFHKMFDLAKWELEKFKELPFYFINFNYDNLLEQKLFEFLVLNKGVDIEEAEGFVVDFFSKKMRHVYGKIDQWSRDLYGSKSFVSPNQIKIIGERLESTDKKILEIYLKEADEIIFLGFGFHFDNIKILPFSRSPHLNGGSISTFFYGTTKGMGNSEISDIRKYLTQHGFGSVDFYETKVNTANNNVECLAYLQNYVSFFDLAAMT